MRSPVIKKSSWLLGMAAVAAMIITATVVFKRSHPARPRHLIIISVDTLRADHLGCYGYQRPTSPTVDAIAAAGVLFEDASATSPWTLPSHASLLTGLYPRRHGAVATNRQISKQAVHLASLLAEHGFHTAAVVNSSFLTGFGLKKGFKDFQYVKEAMQQRTPTAITKKAIQWLRRRDREKQFFLFLHYYDVHSDYVSQPEFESMFVEPYNGQVDGTTKLLRRCKQGQLQLTEDDVRHLRNLYNAGIRQLDDQLAKLFRYLRKHRLLESSLVVITSDHGEQFLEHGGVLHSDTQYQELIRIPLIFHGAAIPSNTRISVPVSLVDVMPTCLALLDLAIPDSLDGVDLQRLWQKRNATLGPRLLFSETEHVKFPNIDNAREIIKMGPNRAVRNDQFKLHYNTATKQYQLYDLIQDPGEQADVKDRHPKVAEMLMKHLDRYLQIEMELGRFHVLSEAEKALLESLGYVGPLSKQP